MIPYIEIETIKFGFITVHIWGLMVSLGFIAGIALGYFLAKKKGIKTDHIFNLAFWILLCSIIGARLFHVLFYDFEYYRRNLIDVFKIWQGGLSVFGGFIGSVIAYIIYVRKHKLDFWKLGDIAVFALPAGLAIGRLGCFFIHDHPGIKSNFFLAVDYPGGPRHDLGLYLVLVNFLIFLIFVLIAKLYKTRFDGFFVIVFCFIYGISRFFLDFLRAWDIIGADKRYFFLTPAQYASVIMVIIGIILFFQLRRKDNRSGLTI